MEEASEEAEVTSEAEASEAEASEAEASEVEASEVEASEVADASNLSNKHTRSTSLHRKNSANTERHPFQVSLFFMSERAKGLNIVKNTTKLRLNA